MIAPGGLIQYHGTQFFVGGPGKFVLAGLVQQGIVRVRVSGSTASEAARSGLGTCIRKVEEAPGGAIWGLGDGDGELLIGFTPR